MWTWIVEKAASAAAPRLVSAVLLLALGLGYGWEEWGKADLRAAAETARADKEKALGDVKTLEAALARQNAAIGKMQFQAKMDESSAADRARAALAKPKRSGPPPATVDQLNERVKEW